MKVLLVAMFLGFCLGAGLVLLLTHSLVSTYRNLSDRFRSEKDLAIAKVMAIRARIDQRVASVGAEAQGELQKLKDLL